MPVKFLHYKLEWWIKFERLFKDFSVTNELCWKKWWNLRQWKGWENNLYSLSRTNSPLLEIINCNGIKVFNRTKNNCFNDSNPSFSSLFWGFQLNPLKMKNFFRSLLKVKLQSQGFLKVNQQLNHKLFYSL